MTQLILCAVAILLLFVISSIWSVFPIKILKMETESIGLRMLLGFLTYFLIFQIFQLPAILGLRVGTRGFSIFYGGTAFAITVLGVVAFRDYTKMSFSSVLKRAKKEVGNPLTILTILTVILAAAFAVIQTINGWDSAYYVSTINSALETNVFYGYESNDGTYVGGIILRTALSGLYSSFTVLCSLFGVKARIMAMYGMRSVCVLMASLITYRFGMVIFKDDEKKSKVLVILWLAFSIFATARHTTAEFLLRRSYEAKGYCANIVIPLVLMCGFAMVMGIQYNFYKKMMLLVCWASVPISMSSFVIIPVAAILFMIVDCLVNKNFKEKICWCILCIIPNIIYLTAFVLSSMGILVIYA